MISITDFVTLWLCDWKIPGFVIRIVYCVLCILGRGSHSGKSRTGQPDQRMGNIAEYPVRMGRERKRIRREVRSEWLAPCNVPERYDDSFGKAGGSTPPGIIADSAPLSLSLSLVFLLPSEHSLPKQQTANSKSTTCPLSSNLQNRKLLIPTLLCLHRRPCPPPGIINSPMKSHTQQQRTSNHSGNPILQIHKMWQRDHRTRWRQQNRGCDAAGKKSALISVGGVQFIQEPRSEGVDRAGEHEWCWRGIGSEVWDPGIKVMVGKGVFYLFDINVWCVESMGLINRWVENLLLMNAGRPLDSVWDSSRWWKAGSPLAKWHTLSTTPSFSSLDWTLMCHRWGWVLKPWFLNRARFARRVRGMLDLDETQVVAKEG